MLQTRVETLSSPKKRIVMTKEPMKDMYFGDLCLRLAKNEEEIVAAQALRYQVFYEEMGAVADAKTLSTKLDVDQFDEYADHLLVVDQRLGNGAEAIVGTYRGLRRDGAKQAGGFYSANEFDLSKLLAVSGEMLELGRSCVALSHRNSSTMNILWAGLANYMVHYDVEYMFGVPSFHGVDPQEYALPLSYLYHYHLADDDIRPVARTDQKSAGFEAVDMNMVAKDAIDPRRALVSLPSLMKGYVRVGMLVGQDAVIDHQFNTIDVCILVKVGDIPDRYLKHYQRSVENAVLDT